MSDHGFFVGLVKCGLNTNNAIEIKNKVGGEREREREVGVGERNSLGTGVFITNHETEAGPHSNHLWEFDE